MSVMGPENGRQREKESPLRLYEGKKRFNETQHLRVLSFCWWSSESLLLTCSGPAMAVQSSVLSHCLLTGSSLSLFAFSSAPRSSIFRCCNRMPETRSLMRKVVYFDSLSYKLRCPCTGFLQGPPAVSAHGGKPRGKRMCEENHNTGAAGLYNNRRAPHPCDLGECETAFLTAGPSLYSPNPSSNTPLCDRISAWASPEQTTLKP